MTEAEWLASEEPEPMLGIVDRASPRKRRLWACACCRRIWSLIADERGRAAVVAAERYADGEVDSFGLAETKRLAEEAAEQGGGVEPVPGVRYAGASQGAEGSPSPFVRYYADGASCVVASRHVRDAIHAWQLCAQATVAAGGPWHEELITLSALMRDIFGNPFRPVAFSPSWRSSTAAALASQMYESRDFGAMPILADALQDAGCDSADVLDHCREPGVHVRGCWVVDLVLGKE